LLNCYGLFSWLSVCVSVHDVGVLCTVLWIDLVFGLSIATEATDTLGSRSAYGKGV